MNHGKENTKKWHVLFVKTRQELKVSERLDTLGIDNYVPFKIVVRQWSDRKKKVKQVLMPSIVLVRIHEREVSQVFSIPGPVRFLFEQGKRAVVSDQEIAALRYYVSGKYDVATPSIKVGDSIVVPALNEEAEVLRIKGKKCFAKLQQLGAVVSFQLS